MVAVHVTFLYVLKSHESFTYVSPDVFSDSSKSLVINALYGMVRVSFSAPNASQSCGAFLLCPGLARLRCSAPVQVWLVQESIGRTTIPCTSLADLVDYRPNPGRLEHKTPARNAFWCTSETCTSRHRLRRTDSHRRDRHCTLPRCR